MLPSRYFWELTQPEIAQQLRSHPLVIFPAGSIEQHGTHLPTGTDTFAAQFVSHEVAERMDGLVLPGTGLGVTPMHMPFEGTITLTPDTFMRVVTETCVSTAEHGARKLMIVNFKLNHRLLSHNDQPTKAPPCGVLKGNQGQWDVPQTGIERRQVSPQHKRPEKEKENR